MKKFGIYFTLFAFVLCLFAVPVLTAAKDEADYSIYENRKLASFPTFSTQLLFNGWYTKAWENYLSDRIAGRNAMLVAYTHLQMNVLKKPVVNDVVISGDVLLPFYSYTTPDMEKQAADISAMLEELSALNDHISANGGRFLYVGVDEQPYAMGDHYPEYLNDNAAHLDAGAQVFFSGLESRGIEYLNMDAEFGADAEQYYSKIDHHFNYSGAYVTYGKIAEKLGLQPAELELSRVPNPFYGSRNRKLYNAFPSDERLVIGQPKSPVAFTRFDNGEQVYAGVYSLPADHTTPVTYTAYMGSDVAETVISTDRPELPNILIFGDSFTNPLETMLYLNADRMHSVDLRHYTEMTLFEYIARHKPDIVICVRDNTNYWTAAGNGTFR